MTVVGRMLGQNIPSSGSAADMSNLMARIGAAIQLLRNPAELQTLINAFHARQNSTDANSQTNTVGEILLFLQRDAIAMHGICTVCPPV